MNKDKINYFFDTFPAANRAESLKKLEGALSYSEEERDFIKQKIDKQFPPAPDATVAPVQWEDEDMNTFPDVHWVIKSLGIAPGPITELCAFVNTGKTLFAADLAVCVANDLKVFDKLDVQAPGKVMHIDFESGETMCKIYYKRILNGKGLSSFKNIKFYQPKWRLDDIQLAEEELSNILSDYKMCIVDCFSAGVPSTKQNEESARGPIDMLNRVSEKTGCAIVLLVHEPKQTGDDPLRSVKGSGGIIAAAGSSLHLKRDFGSDICTLTRGKIRLGKNYTTNYKYEAVGEYNEKIDNSVGCKFVIVEGEVRDFKKEMLQLIQKSPGIPTEAIKNQIEGMRTADKVNLLASLVSEELVSFVLFKGKTKQHTITSAGQSFLAYEASNV